MHDFTPLPDFKIGTYRHYKGHMCQVLGIARSSENHEELFVAYYHPDSDGNQVLWIRPYTMFIEYVTPDGETSTPELGVLRFEYLGE